MRDYQRGRVYSWENKFLPKLSPYKVQFDQIQTIVNYVWTNEGLENPPSVKEIPIKSKSLADSERLTLRFHMRKLIVKRGKKPRMMRYRTHLFTVFHEIAHAMNEDLSGITRGAIHGKEFLGVYLYLLEKYLHIPTVVLLASASDHHLQIDLSARPVKGFLKESDEQE